LKERFSVSSSAFFSSGLAREGATAPAAGEVAAPNGLAAGALVSISYFCSTGAAASLLSYSPEGIFSLGGSVDAVAEG